MNKFGLTRYIPSDVSLAVRQRCGFGCVVCGSALFDYEHFEPEFKDALKHEPEGIILLCPNHHRAKGGFVSETTLRRCAANPFCKTSGFSHTPMDIEHLRIEIGPMIVERCLTALEVKSSFSISRIAIGSKLYGWMPAFSMPRTIKAIWFDPPEEDGAPLRLNATINGPNNRSIAWISKNVWYGSHDNIDIQIISGKEKSKINIKDLNGKVLLDLEFRPPNLIKITQFLSHYDEKIIEISGNHEGGQICRNGKILIQGSEMYTAAGTAMSI